MYLNSDFNSLYMHWEWPVIKKADDELKILDELLDVELQTVHISTNHEGNSILQKKTTKDFVYLVGKQCEFKQLHY